jgi:hypothetical protein
MAAPTGTVPVYSGGSKTQAGQLTSVISRVGSLEGVNAASRLSSLEAFRTDTEDELAQLVSQVSQRLTKADFNTKVAIISTFISDFFGEYNIVKDGTSLAPANYSPLGVTMI